MPENPDSLDRYADALLALAEGAGRAARVCDDLAAVIDWLQNQPAVQRFLIDPHVLPEGKRAALAGILDGRLDPLLLQFLGILNGEGVLRRLPDVAQRFFARLAARDGATAGEVVSAHPLADALVAEIESEAGRLLGRRVTLRPRLDPEMLGGVRLRVGNLVVDGSLETRLEQLRRALAD